MADAGRERVGSMVLGAWDAFLDQASAVDLDRPSRLPRWRAHEICVKRDKSGNYPYFRGVFRN